LARLRRLARYCQHTRALVLDLELDASLDEELVLYADASFAADDQRKSTTGYALFLQGVLLATASKTQNTIALSSAEAELLALNSAVAEALFARSILEQMLHRQLPIKAYVDSTACMAIVSRQGLGRLRHIQVRHLWLQNLVQSKEVLISKVGTDDNPADLLTKQLLPAKVEFHRELLGLRDEEET
jgi:ribonuclease HI